MINKKIEKFDLRLIRFLRTYGDVFGRVAFFTIFVWFGSLKVFGISAATPLVTKLFEATFLNHLGDPEIFLIVFGIFEMAIGIIAFIPKLERITFIVMGLHLVTTVLPLFILQDETWSSLFVPTLTGQYIMKNIALLALGMLLMAHIKPMAVTHSVWAEEDEERDAHTKATKKI